ncbi:Uncharacterised protein [Legionella pneumophila]|nr:Uncharacterised protein [Legionella pneumophila]
MTRDTPNALKCLPANSSLCALADAGNCSPETCEKLTPAFSKTFPFVIILVLPPPPAARCQESSWNLVLPSIDSSKTQIVFWSWSR